MGSTATAIGSDDSFTFLYKHPQDKKTLTTVQE